MKEKSISISKLVLVCVIIFSIVPDIGFKFSTAGFTWTAYRMMIAASVIAVTLTGGIIQLTSGKFLSKWITFMAFWSGYGLLLLFIGEYSDRHNGFVEWLSIFFGLIVFGILRITLLTRERRELAIKVVYWLLNLLLAIGLIEIVTGRHWSGSAVYDATSSIYEYQNMHLATGLMYNMNDFSAMITCMTPVLLDSKLGKKRIITFIGVLSINIINDATTCTLAIALFIIYYLFILKGDRSQRKFVLGLAFWVMLFLLAFSILVIGTDLTDQSGFLGALARQISNAKNGTGSLYVRIVMYKDAIKAFLSTGMMGLGPRGFPRYFELNKSLSGLTNPHSLLLELLSQYGIIIGIWFVGLLVWMLRSAIKLYNSETGELQEQALMVMAFVIIYSIASFAPSSFIGYSYQWLLIGIICAQLDKSLNLGGIADA